MVFFFFNWVIRPLPYHQGQYVINRKIYWNFFQLKCQTIFLYSNTPPTLPMALKIICISLHVPKARATNWVFSLRKNNTFREMFWCNPKHLNFSWGFDFQHDLDCYLFLLLVFGFLVFVTAIEVLSVMKLYVVIYCVHSVIRYALEVSIDKHICVH